MLVKHGVLVYYIYGRRAGMDNFCARGLQLLHLHDISVYTHKSALSVGLYISAHKCAEIQDDQEGKFPPIMNNFTSGNRIVHMESVI